MIVTHKWLKEFVDFDLSAQQLSHQLTMAGLEVEYMQEIGAGLDSVVVARLDSVEPHPQADRLTKCQVFNGAEVIPVVCGATNHKAGDLVALAQVGTVLPDGLKIKKSKIRGEESRGMLCSVTELGLGKESEGILILPSGLELGTPVFEALGLKDVRYEIGLTPNRADCLSVLGIAREVAAFTHKPLHLPARATFAPIDTEINALTSVSIETPEGCPRYMARLVRGVRVGPSPQWLIQRLEAVGMRSINNIVDVTNYVLMELGHPLHAFDFNRLAGKRIVVRQAAEASSFTTLDGQLHELCSEDVVVCDAEKPIALAGVMGGENSEVTHDTVDILLESAYFDPRSIRRTSKKTGIHSEASHRFERGADIDMVPLALDRAADLIQQICGATVLENAIDAYPCPIQKRIIVINRKRTNALLGLELGLEQIEQLLASIGLCPQRLDMDTTEVTVPTARHDLEREVDLIEEVARLNGYDNIPITMPVSQVVPPIDTHQIDFVRELRNVVVAQGMREIINYSFESTLVYERLCLNADDYRRRHVAVLNPLTEEQSVMRTSLVPAMLDTLGRNLAHKSSDLSLFELRPVFIPGESAQPDERMNLCFALSGQRERQGWAHTNVEVDFYDLKGIAEVVFERFGLESPVFIPDSPEPYLHPGKSCSVYCGGRNAIKVGVLGELHPQVQEHYSIEQPVYIAELDVEKLFARSGQTQTFKPISKFPDSYRDSAFLVKEEITAQQMLEVINNIKVKYLEDVVLFDIYAGKGISEGMKSLALRMRYRSAEKTLAEEEISAMHAKIVKALHQNLGAEIR
ncbi:MAG: phenylalanine--tRNA ligase subunit beta [Desulfuromonadaceae bacterium]|nr:phenylalanine--tRNA ligase subunit beta [Desulfuromonas sp.]MDY0184610.1 phenylalanine--tRNA ligase subunit beta [Desulfuromonadaceae bacterium]